MNYNDYAFTIMEHFENMPDGNNLSSYYKESFSKVILSAFLYLNSEFTHIYPDFPTFYQVIKKNIVNIKFIPIINREESIWGKHIKNIILLKESLKTKELSFLLKIFAHEIAHAISYGNYSIGIIPRGIWQNNRYHYINELETEYLSIKFLKHNYNDNLQVFKYEKNLYSKKETLSLHYTYMGTTYPSLSVYANIINHLFGKYLCSAYLTDGMTLKSLFSEGNFMYLYNDFIGFEKAYKHFTNWKNIKKFKSAEQFPLKYYDKMYCHISNMVLCFIKHNNLSNSDYRALADIIMENQIYMSNNEKSLNEMLIAKMEKIWSA